VFAVTARTDLGGSRGRGDVAGNPQAAIYRGLGQDGSRLLWNFGLLVELGPNRYSSNVGLERDHHDAVSGCRDYRLRHEPVATAMQAAGCLLRLVVGYRLLPVVGCRPPHRTYTGATYRPGQSSLENWKRGGFNSRPI